MIIFRVNHPDDPGFLVLVSANGREGAKRQARHILGRNPDQYVVEPITKSGNKVIVLLAE